MFRHLLVPTDGSQLSDLAVDRAISLAKNSGASITFYFARADSDTAPTRDSTWLRAVVLSSVPSDLLAHAADQQAQDIISRAEAKAKEAGVSYDSVTGISEEPYMGISEAAQSKGCDLILMASHGRRGVKGLIIGSQTQKVLVYSKIPVLVYR